MATKRVWSRLFLLAALCLATPITARAQDCSKAERENADRELWLSTADKTRSIARHLPWGVPKATQPVTGEKQLVQRDYIITYDQDLLVPIWTAHELRGLALGRVTRLDCFRRDPRLDAPGAALPADYTEPVFDQGHLVPAADMTTAKNAMVNSFVMSNMAPQHCEFNRGVWQILESIMRLWAKDYSTVYVLAGSIFDADGNGLRDRDTDAVRVRSNNGKMRVAVPTHFFKIVLRKTPSGGVESVAFVLPNDETDLNGEAALRYIGEHIRPIADVEKVTGLRLLPNLSASLHEAAAPTLWAYSGKPEGSLAFGC